MRFSQARSAFFDRDLTAQSGPVCSVLHPGHQGRSALPNMCMIFSMCPVSHVIKLVTIFCTDKNRDPEKGTP